MHSLGAKMYFLKANHTSDSLGTFFELKTPFFFVSYNFLFNFMQTVHKYIIKILEKIPVNVTQWSKSHKQLILDTGLISKTPISIFKNPPKIAKKRLTPHCKRLSCVVPNLTIIPKCTGSFGEVFGVKICSGNSFSNNKIRLQHIMPIVFTSNPTDQASYGQPWLWFLPL